jgi:hypothetical protein
MNCLPRAVRLAEKLMSNSRTIPIDRHARVAVCYARRRVSVGVGWRDRWQAAFFKSHIVIAAQLAPQTLMDNDDPTFETAQYCFGHYHPLGRSPGNDSSAVFRLW